MTNLLRGWKANSNGAGDEIAAANRAMVGGERRVLNANFAYQMALSQGDPSKIHAAEANLKAALAEDIRRKGGRHEDILLMQRSFHGIEATEFNKWLLWLGLATTLYYFVKTSV